jgi:hypothetical protein
MDKWCAYKKRNLLQKMDNALNSVTLSKATSYPGLFASAVGWSAKKALASAGLFCNLIGQ